MLSIGLQHGWALDYQSMRGLGQRFQQWGQVLYGRDGLSHPVDLLICHSAGVGWVKDESIRSARALVLLAPYVLLDAGLQEHAFEAWRRSCEAWTIAPKKMLASFYRRANVPQTWRLSPSGKWGERLHSLANCSQSVLPALSEMAQRLILVYGQQDRIVHPRSLEAIRVVLPQARFIQVPNVGHELLWTHGSLIEEICRESLRDAGKEAAPFSGGKGIQPLQSLL